METKETRCHHKSAVNATCLLGNKGCYENGKCHYMGNCEHKVLTNADRIRAMSDEELAKWLVKKTKYQESAWSAPSYLNFLTESDDTMESAIKGTAEWLKQPADMRGEEE